MEAQLIDSIELHELPTQESPPPRKLGGRLDLVEHVKIRLTVSLGSAEVSVAELFALGVGNVVPLDKAVDAPVDLSVNGRIVGRGTLVAVGDQFGVRITEMQQG